MKFYEPENILKSKENIEKTEEKIKSEMPWDSDDSVYDKTSKYFSDVENENSFIGFESFNRFGNNNEDFVFEEETNTMIEKNEELEMPPAFKTKTEKTTDKIEKILTDADEFEAPPPFKTYHMQKAKPIEKTIDEDEFEAPPSFKNTSESKSVSAKFKGSLAKKI